MTREEAQNIPELHIEVTDFIEDVFYMKLAINKTISLEVGEMASEWVKKEKKNNFATRLIEDLD